MWMVRVYTLLLCYLTNKITSTNGFTLPSPGLSPQLPRNPRILSNTTINPVKNLPNVSPFKSGSTQEQRFVNNIKPNGLNNRFSCNGNSADTSNIPDLIASESTVSSVYNFNTLPQLTSTSSSNNLPATSTDCLRNSDKALSSRFQTPVLFNTDSSSVDINFVSPLSSAIKNVPAPTNFQPSSSLTAQPSNNFRYVPLSANNYNTNVLELPRDTSIKNELRTLSNVQSCLTPALTLNTSPTLLGGSSPNTVPIDATATQNQSQPLSPTVDCYNSPPIISTLTGTAFPNVIKAPSTGSFVQFEPQSSIIRCDFPKTLDPSNTLYTTQLSAGTVCAKDVSSNSVAASNKIEPKSSIKTAHSCKPTSINSTAANFERLLRKAQDIAPKSSGIFLPFTADNNLISVSSNANKFNNNEANEFSSKRNAMSDNIGATGTCVSNVMPSISLNSASPKTTDSILIKDPLPIVNAKFGLPGQMFKSNFLSASQNDIMSPSVTPNCNNAPFSLIDSGSILEANVNSLNPNLNSVMCDQRSSVPLTSPTSYLNTIPSSISSMTPSFDSSLYEFIPQGCGLSYLNMTPTIQNVNIPVEFVNKFTPASSFTPSCSPNGCNTFPSSIEITPLQFTPSVHNCKSSLSIPEVGTLDLTNSLLTSNCGYNIKPETLDLKITPMIPPACDSNNLQVLATSINSDRTSLNTLKPLLVASSLPATMNSPLSHLNAPTMSNQQFPNNCGVPLLSPTSFDLKPSAFIVEPINTKESNHQISFTNAPDFRVPSLFEIPNLQNITPLPSPITMPGQQFPNNIRPDCGVPLLSPTTVDLKTLDFNPVIGSSSTMNVKQQMPITNGPCYGVTSLSQIPNTQSDLQSPPRFEPLVTNQQVQSIMISPCLSNPPLVSSYCENVPLSIINSQTNPSFLSTQSVANQKLASNSGTSFKVESLPKTSIDISSQLPIGSGLPFNKEPSKQITFPLTLSCPEVMSIPSTPCDFTPAELPSNIPINMQLLSNLPQCPSSAMNPFLSRTISPCYLQEPNVCPVEKITNSSEPSRSQCFPPTTNYFNIVPPLSSNYILPKSCEAFPSNSFFMTPETSLKMTSNLLRSPILIDSSKVKPLLTESNIQFIQNPQVNILPSVTLASPESVRPATLTSNNNAQSQSLGLQCPKLTPLQTLPSPVIPLNDLSRLLQQPFLKMSPILNTPEVVNTPCGVTMKQAPMCVLNPPPLPPQVINPPKTITSVNNFCPTYFDTPFFPPLRNNSPLIPTTKCAPSVPFVEVLAPILQTQLIEPCSPRVSLSDVNLPSLYSSGMIPQYPPSIPVTIPSSIEATCSKEISCAPISSSNTKCSKNLPSLSYAQPLLFAEIPIQVPQSQVCVAESMSEILVPFDACSSNFQYEPILISESTLPIINLPNTEVSVSSCYSSPLCKEADIQYCLVDIPIAPQNMDPCNQLTILDNSYMSHCLPPSSLPACYPPTQSITNIDTTLAIPMLDPNYQNTVLFDLLCPNTGISGPNNIPVTLNDLPSAMPFVSDSVLNPSVSEVFILDDSMLCPFNSPISPSNSISSVSTLPNVYFTAPRSCVDYEHPLSSPLASLSLSANELASQLTNTFISSALSNLTALYMEPTCPSIQQIPSVSVPEKNSCNRKSRRRSRKSSKKSKCLSDPMYVSASEVKPTFTEPPSSDNENSVDTLDSVPTPPTNRDDEWVKKL